MKITALEEHFVIPAVSEAWARIPVGERDLILPEQPEIKARLKDFTNLRLKQMDESGVDVQVMSLTSPGVQNLEPSQAVELARQLNDTVAAAVRKNPDRFQGFATLPTPEPSSGGN